MVSKGFSLPRMKRDRIFEQVSAEIKKQIYRGILKPGDRLAPENEMARSLNVSRQTIRESMRILELSGFITIKRGVNGGPIIENTISNRVSQGLSEAIQMGPATLEDLIATWRLIEKEVLPQVIKKADEENIKSLRDIIERAKEKLEERTPIFHEIIEFHKDIAKSSKNHIFTIVLNSIMAVYADFLSRLQPELKAAKQVMGHHEDMLKAIVEKNEKEAIACLERHMNFLKKRFEPIFSENQELGRMT